MKRPPRQAFRTNYMDENLPAGSLVGLLSSSDPDAGDTITYSLVEGYYDNLSFSIDGDNLETVGPFDYETNSYYYIQVRATDAGGLYSDSYYTVYVNKRKRRAIGHYAFQQHGCGESASRIAGRQFQRL